jgi:tetratricopeptide (TPR) repeat protein
VVAHYELGLRNLPKPLLRSVAGFLFMAALLSSLTGCGSLVAEQRNAQGVKYFQQGQYTEALREFHEATYADPRNGDGYYNLAATYHRMGREGRSVADLKQAEKFYNDCLDRNPSHIDCHRGLAVLLIDEGQKDAAFRLVQGWVDREPRSADAKVELARLSDEFGNRQAAQDCLVEAIEAQPDNARALTALGKIRDDAGDKTQALANYQLSLARDSRQPQVASRVAALQGGSPAPTAGAVPASDGLAPPAIDMGSRMADRPGNMK